MAEDILEIRLLGDFRLSLGDVPVNGVGTGRHQSLLAYLVMHRGASQSRLEVAASFWPDSKEKQALNNLRNLLYLLRRQWPVVDEYLVVDTKYLLWRQDTSFDLDVARFERYLKRAEEWIQRGDEPPALQALKQAADLYRGDLLPGHYDEWIYPERERLHQVFNRALEKLVQLLETRRSYPDAIFFARRLLQIDPLREPSYRTLMRLHALNQDRTGVVEVYRACAAVLKREFELEPESATQELFHRLMDGQANGPPETVPETGKLPLVGRAREWQTLQTAWSKSEAGQARLLAISGEAGIGKTRLSEEFISWAMKQGIATVLARCYAAEGRLAYVPVVEWLRSETLRRSWIELHEIWLTEVARLLPETRVEHPDLVEAGPITESWQRLRLHEALARAILSPGRPMLLFIDDLQWCDQESLEWLRYLLRFAPFARLLILCTIRLEEVESDHPVRMLLLDLARSSQATEVVLGPLDVEETTRLAEQVTQSPLEESRAVRIHRETGGSPLFIIETIRAGTYTYPSLGSDPSVPHHTGLLPGTPGVPVSVQLVITQRMSQLSPEARALATLAATIGRAFTLEILERAGSLEEDPLIDALEELIQRRVVRLRRDGEYDFTHEQLREAMYTAASPARRQRLHQRIAEALLVIHAQNPDAISAQIAMHLDRAGRIEEAIAWYRRAADLVRQVYANQEVVRLLSRAYDLIRTLPSHQERNERELSCLLSIGSALIATKGWADPEVGTVYGSARDLCKDTDDKVSLFAALWGLWTYHLVRAELRTALDLAHEFTRNADNDSTRSAAHLALFITLFHLGEFEAAERQMELADTTLFKQESWILLLPGVNLDLFFNCYASHILSHTGYQVKSFHYAERAVTLARRSVHPFEETIALYYSAMVHQFRGEVEEARLDAAASVARSSQYGYAYYLASGQIIEGWAHFESTRKDRGLAQMESGLDTLRRTGARLRIPYYLALIADRYGQVGQIEKGLALLSEAENTIRSSDERWIEAEVIRIRAKLLIEVGHPEEAQACYRQAIDLAGRQQNRSTRLKATLGLAQLLHRLGNTSEARTQLNHVESEFSDGFEISDLSLVRQLLEAWA